ncbi:hypothetical protein ACNJYA_08155 [Bradyrhizobium sp. DASA03068]|uniref:hypothetical protein n=1 Tax=Bradyrhizobium sp. BLXBL-01 TaxID=3395915 RepID=UPI003F708607
MGAATHRTARGQHGSQRLLRPARAVKKLRKVSSSDKEMLMPIDPRARAREEPPLGVTSEQENRTAEELAAAEQDCWAVQVVYFMFLKTL